MKLLQYSFKAQHVKGIDLSDALSRAPHVQPTEDGIIMDEEISCQANEIIKYMPATTPYLRKVTEEILKDHTQKRLITTKAGWSNSKEIRPYWDSQHDLAKANEIIIKGCRVVIPRTLQHGALTY